MKFDNEQQQYESLLTIMNPPQVNIINDIEDKTIQVTFRVPTDDGNKSESIVFKLFLVGKATTTKNTYNQAFCYDITQPMQVYQYDNNPLQLQSLSHAQLIEYAHQAIGKFWWNLVQQKFYFGADTIDKVINDIGSFQLCAVGYTHNQDIDSKPNGALFHKSDIKDADDALGNTSEYDPLIRQYLYKSLPKPLQTDDFAYAKDYQVISNLDLKQLIDTHKAKDIILGQINAPNDVKLDFGVASSLEKLITQQCSADQQTLIKARLNRDFMMGKV